MNDDFRISVTVKVNSLKVIDFNIGVVSDDTIVDQVDGIRVVMVGMSILSDFFSTSGPSGVSDTNIGSDNVFGDLLDDSFDTVDCGLLGVSMFDYDGC